MISGRNGAVAILFTALIGHAVTARANTPEDIQGVGARNNGMGGGATASASDFTAAYYNPAGLSRCADSHIGVDIRHTVYGLHVRRIGADAPPESPKPTRDQTRVTSGLCLHLPYNITMGFMLGIGLQNQMTLDLSQPNSRPQWIMYGETLEQLSIALGFSYKPIEQLSLGFGGSVLINTDLSFGATVPVAVDNDGDGFTDPLGVNLRLNVVPTGAPYLGVHFQPIPQLRLGATFRGAMYLNLDVPATIRANALGGIELPIPVQVQGVGWYTPRQLAVGVAVDPVRDLTLTADVTFYNWGALANSYYPFLAVKPQSGYDSGVVGALGYQRMGKPGWHNIVQPRLGGEVRILDSRLAIRAGYSFRPSALPNPGTRTMLSNDGFSRIQNITTLLDTSVHTISAGLGYSFGQRADERAAEQHEEGESDPPPSPATAFVLPYDADGFELEPIDLDDAEAERGAQSTRASRERARRARAAAEAEAREQEQAEAQAQAQPRGPTTTTTTTPTSTTVETVEPMYPSGSTATTTPTATATATPTPTQTQTAAATSTSPTAAAPATATMADPSEDDEEDDELPGLVGTIDVFIRANLLSERTDSSKDIQYGGAIYDLGIQMTLGWY